MKRPDTRCATEARVIDVPICGSGIIVDLDDPLHASNQEVDHLFEVLQGHVPVSLAQRHPDLEDLRLVPRVFSLPSCWACVLLLSPSVPGLFLFFRSSRRRLHVVVCIEPVHIAVPSRPRQAVVVALVVAGPVFVVFLAARIVLGVLCVRHGDLGFPAARPFLGLRGLRHSPVGRGEDALALHDVEPHHVSGDWLRRPRPGIPIIELEGDRGLGRSTRLQSLSHLGDIHVVVVESLDLRDLLDKRVGLLDVMDVEAGDEGVLIDNLFMFPVQEQSPHLLFDFRGHSDRRSTCEHHEFLSPHDLGRLGPLVEQIRATGARRLQSKDKHDEVEIEVRYSDLAFVDLVCIILHGVGRRLPFDEHEPLSQEQLRLDVPYSLDLIRLRSPEVEPEVALRLLLSQRCAACPGPNRLWPSVGTRLPAALLRAARVLHVALLVAVCKFEALASGRLAILESLDILLLLLLQPLPEQCECPV
mmetsp:Transcript_9422/g.27230  ORF Transcript_9422/g.27230 Transcript_9422/m.27230 type:complete len:473 (+) Transcript_9422:289-1707(+)